ncbi:MAG: hypothetical protein PHR35_22635 [Kiritimatiellae bacterium]|nr:hypothetical protein [Kiritimatiellia bacterium]
MSVRPNYEFQGNPMCTDDGDVVQLTDGRLSTNRWWDKAMVGFDSGPFDITIDLEQEFPIEAVEVRVASTEDGRYFPKRIVVLVSDDLKTYRVAGQTVKNPADVAGKLYHWFRIDRLRTRGRYVVVSFIPDRAFIPLDEIRVLKGSHGLEEVSFENSKSLHSTMLLPLSESEVTYVPVAQVVPLILRRQEAGLIVDLPPDIRPIPGHAYSSPVAVNEANGPYQRYRAKDPTRYLFFETDLPAGSRRDLRLQKTIEDGRALEQWIAIEVIEIGRAPMPQRLITCVGWQPSDLYFAWPGFLNTYRDFGLNTLSIIGGDVGSKVPNAPLDALIASARARGMSVVGYFSPLNLNSKYVERDPSLRRAVSLSGKSLAFPCPLEYLNRIVYDELAYLRRGVAHGLFEYWLDSETGFPGDICFCESCLERFRRFVESKEPGVPLEDPRIFERSPDKHPEWHRRWTTAKAAFGVEAMTRLRDELQKESVRLHPRTAPDVSIALYGFTPDGGYDRGFITFGALHAAGVVKFAMPVCYTKSATEIAAFIRSNREAIPDAGMVAWMPSRWIPDTGKEWDSACLPARILALLTNGGKGFTVQGMGGFDGLDYKYLVKALNLVVPVEEILVEGSLLDRDAVRFPENEVHVSGMTLNGETVLLLMDFRKQECAGSLRIDEESMVIDLAAKKVTDRLAPGHQKITARPGEHGLAFLMIVPVKRADHYRKPISLRSSCSGGKIEFEWFPNALAGDRHVFQYAASPAFTGDVVTVGELDRGRHSVSKVVLDRGYKFWRVGAGPADAPGGIAYSDAREIRVSEDLGDSQGTAPGTGLPPRRITLVGIQDGQTISGRLAVEAEVEGMPVARVEFHIDDNLAHREGGAPYFLYGDYQTWNTSTVSNGPHTLSATAFDHEGNSIGTKLRLIVGN